MKEKILKVITNNLIQIIPELENTNISEHEKLVNLGANSLDRGELITMTLEELDIDVPRIRFATAETIEDLASLIADHT